MQQVYGWKSCCTDESIYHVQAKYKCQSTLQEYATDENR